MHDQSNLIRLTPDEERVAHAREITRRYLPKAKGRRIAVPFALAIAIHVLVLGGGWWLANTYLEAMTTPPPRVPHPEPAWSLMSPADGSVWATVPGDDEFLSPTWAETQSVPLKVGEVIAPSTAWHTR